MLHWDLSASINESNFQLTLFWVQNHNVPPEFFHEENAQRLGQKISIKTEIEIPISKGCLPHSFMRLRVQIDLGF